LRYQHNLKFNELVDDQLVLCRRLHRQVGRLLTLENPPGVDADLAIGNKLGA
jgi:hypothetical protein